MGYSYGRNARGNMSLACDVCGSCEGARKRTCPYKVRGDSLRTVPAPTRYELPWCPAPARR